MDAAIKYGSHRKAAKSLGISRSGVRSHLEAVKIAAAKQGWSPEHDMTRSVPDGFHVKGVSTYYDEDGNVHGQWVKSQADAKDRAIRLIEAVKGAFESHKKVPVIKAPKQTMKDTLTVYPFGDPHIGMYAWAEEAGEDFDLEIAERNIVSAVNRLVDCSPPSHFALLANLGDFFHADNKNNTPTAGTQLDVDGRRGKVYRVGVRAMRACIEAALEKHREVRVINEIGNHDWHTSQMLTIALEMLYEKNKRVTFDASPAAFHYHRFGQNLIGISHGDKCKPENLGPIMASDRPEDWGDTRFRCWYTGHVHHRRVFEVPGCTVESFRTLAAKDAWTASSGYRAGRDMQAIVHHKQWGEIERHRVDIALLEAK